MQNILSVFKTLYFVYLTIILPTQRLEFVKCDVKEKFFSFKDHPNFYT